MNRCLRLIKNFKPSLNVRRSFGSSTDPLKSKETVEENLYINRQERDTLKKLLKQVKQQLDKDHEENEIKDLKNIFDKFGVKISEELIKDIRGWRDIHH